MMKWSKDLAVSTSTCHVKGQLNVTMGATQKEWHEAHLHGTVGVCECIDNGRTKDQHSVTHGTPRPLPPDTEISSAMWQAVKWDLIRCALSVLLKKTLLSAPSLLLVSAALHWISNPDVTGNAIPTSYLWWYFSWVNCAEWYNMVQMV